MTQKKMMIKIELPDLTDPESRTYLIRSLGYWGKGKTLEEAKKNTKKAGWKAKDGAQVFEVDNATFVDGFGSICTPPRNAIGEPVEHRNGAVVYPCDGDPIPGEMTKYLGEI